VLKEEIADVIHLGEQADEDTPSDTNPVVGQDFML
jgi:hypothetical protein